jgi:transcriptional regulator with XRE-family HTH domain
MGPQKEPGMSSKLAPAIRTARRAAGLTQQELGMRLGLKGRAVYRWERDASAPAKARRKALVGAIEAVNRDAAAQLAAAFAEAIAPAAAAAPAPPPTPAPLSGPLALELAIFSMADELDLPPRRLRAALMKLLERMRQANISFEVCERQLAAWSAGERAAATTPK